MNRRNLLQRAGATAIGALAALVGIRPKKASESPEFFPVANLCDVAALPCKVVLHGGTSNGPLQLWLGDRFYIDLPEERYTDTVYVDWMKAEELVDGDRYAAQCRVCPELGEPWEILQMKRVDG